MSVQTGNPPAVVADAWEYFSIGPTVLTASSVAQLSRGTYEPEIVVDSIIATEYAGSGSTFTVRKVASGASDAAAANILTAVPIAANETVLVPEMAGGSLGLVLNAGDSIKALAANASRVNLTINYRKRR